MNPRMQVLSDVRANSPSVSADQVEARHVRRVFWVAFLVRLAYITLAHTYRMRTFPDHFEYGWEMGRIARALVAGRGFADPFDGHTGPTAWVGPLYPLLIALVFKLAGIYALTSAWLLLAFNSLCNALIVFPLAAIGRRCFPARVGHDVTRWAVWLWALYPAAMQYAVRWVWEMSVSTLLFTSAFALALRLRDHGSSEDGGAPDGKRALRDWALFGLAWGTVALSNPALVIFLPFAGLWALAGRGWPSLRALAGPVLSGLIFCALLAPWIARDQRVFHHFVPLRANFGAELALGNGPGATGLLMEYHHPQKDPAQLRLYRELGEYRYAQMRGALAHQTIAADPALFARNILRRVYFLWFGLPPAGGAGFTSFFRSLNYGFISSAGLLGLLVALRRRLFAAWLMAFAFLALPAVYYLVTAHARFRHPLEPLMALLGVYLFQSAERGRRWTVDPPAVSR
jgi:hypothetical protein